MEKTLERIAYALMIVFVAVIQIWVPGGMIWWILKEFK